MASFGSEILRRPWFSICDIAETVDPRNPRCLDLFRDLFPMILTIFGCFFAKHHFMAWVFHHPSRQKLVETNLMPPSWRKGHVWFKFPPPPKNQTGHPTNLQGGCHFGKPNNPNFRNLHMLFPAISENATGTVFASLRNPFRFAYASKNRMGSLQKPILGKPGGFLCNAKTTTSNCWGKKSCTTCYLLKPMKNG